MVVYLHPIQASISEIHFLSSNQCNFNKFNHNHSKLSNYRYQTVLLKLILISQRQLKQNQVVHQSHNQQSATSHLFTIAQAKSVAESKLRKTNTCKRPKKKSFIGAKSLKITRILQSKSAKFFEIGSLPSSLDHAKKNKLRFYRSNFQCLNQKQIF